LFFQLVFPLFVLQMLPDSAPIRWIYGGLFAGLMILSLLVGIWVGTRDTEDAAVSRSNVPRDTSVEFKKGVRLKESRTGRCRVCCVVVDDTTRHCKRCNKCIAGHDHHCRWLNCCIGRANIRGFYLLLVLMTAAALVEGAVVFRVLYMYVFNHAQFKLYAEDRFNLPLWFTTTLCMVTVVLTLMTYAGLAQLAVLHCKLYAHGTTTAEWIKRTKRREKDLESGS
jgi:hypothetical protein